MNFRPIILCYNIFYVLYLFNFRKYNLGGAYRRILQIPSNLSWNITHYSEKHSDLIMCDMDEMRRSSAPKNDPSIIFHRYIFQFFSVH